MRKRLFVFVVFLTSSAFAQITSGTIIIFNFTRDRLVIAADSRGVNTDTMVPHDSECKISSFGHHLIFTSAGNVRHRKGSASDSVNSWDNREATNTAFRAARQLPTGNAQVQMISTGWADAMVENWRSFYQAYPEKVKRLVSRTGGLTAGAFAEATHGAMYFRGAEIKFDQAPTSMGDPIAAGFGDTLSSCWECGQGNKVCALGKHFDVAAKFCSQRKSDDVIQVRTQLKRASKAARLAVKITELTVDAYSKTPGDVGGMVDAVTLKNDGSITWNAIKENCSADQN
jgi:hypothetical protein